MLEKIVPTLELLVIYSGYILKDREHFLMYFQFNCFNIRLVLFINLFNFDKMKGLSISIVIIFYKEYIRRVVQ